MYFSRESLIAHRSDGALSIEPFQAASLRSASYVLHLSGWTRRWRPSSEAISVSDPVSESAHMREREFADVLQIDPGEFVLGRSIERVGISSHVAGVLSPLSHVARFGLSVTCGADWVSPGFGATTPTPITFELLNNGPSPLLLRRGIGVCHLRIAPLAGSARPRIGETAASPYDGGDGLSAPHLEIEPLLDWDERGVER